MKHKLINCLVTISNVEVTFSQQQWTDYKNNDVSLFNVATNDAFNIDLIRYKRYITFGVALSLGFLLTTVQANASTSVGPDSITNLGRTFVSIIQQAGYWICFAKGLIDIIKEVLKGGDKAEGIGKIMVKYVLAFSSFYLLPFLFDMIKNNFAV